MSRPSLAAAALVLSIGEGDCRLLLLKRSMSLRAMPGYAAFPGGVIDAADRDVAVEGLEPGDQSAAIVCAVRETFEETGILAVDGDLPATLLADLRLRMSDGGLGFGEALAELGVTLHGADFEACGRWHTPPISPRRFNTHFFHRRWVGSTEVSPAAAEVAEAGWVSPATALAEWRDAERLMVPPVRNTTAAFVDGVEGASERARAHPSAGGGAVTLVDPHQDARMVPLRTSTLPPFTHTNCMILGDRELLVVDPAGATPEAQKVLDDHLQALVDEGRRLVAVVLTHQHPDHIGGVAHALERWQLPLWAHAETASRIDSPVARLLEDGEILELAGDHVTRWQALHLPGHAYGHLCFLETTTRTCVTGDNVLGVGTTLINPPEGDMAIYLASLERMEQLGIRTILPGHGPPIADGTAKIAALIRHRLMREKKVLKALEAAHSLEALLPLVYDDAAPAVMPLAMRSLMAHLDKLVKEGRVAASSDVYALAVGERP